MNYAILYIAAAIVAGVAMYDLLHRGIKALVLRLAARSLRLERQARKRLDVTKIMGALK